LPAWFRRLPIAEHVMTRDFCSGAMFVMPVSVSRSEAADVLILIEAKSHRLESVLPHAVRGPTGLPAERRVLRTPAPAAADPPSTDPPIMGG